MVWKALAALGLVVAIGAGILAWLAWQHGNDWHERADDRAALIEDLEASLDASTQEVAALEARIEELALEKAGTETEAEAAAITADQLEALVQQAGLVAQDLDTCARGAVEAVNLVSSLGDYDLDQVGNYTAQVEEVCNLALGENQALQDVIASLSEEE